MAFGFRKTATAVIEPDRYIGKFNETFSLLLLVYFRILCGYAKISVALLLVNYYPIIFRSFFNANHDKDAYSYFYAFI
jgi:hypothetical protein